MFASDQALVPEAQKEHWEIYRAIKRKDPVAVERLVRSHIEHVAKTVHVGAPSASATRAG